MDKKIQDIFELNLSPMLAVENHRIILANAPAQKLYRRDIIGKSPTGLLPDHILGWTGEELVCSANIMDKSFSASLRRCGGILYVSLKELTPPKDTGDFLSDYMMNALSTSLFNVGMALELARRDLEDSINERLKKHLSILNHNYFCLRHSILNLNTALALKKDSLYFDTHPVDLCLLCSELATTLSRILGKSGVSLEFSTPLGQLLAELDVEKTERILLNILCNSFTYSSPGGKVSMRLEQCGSNAVISIDDKGCGMSAEILSNVFSRYEEPLSTDGLSRVSSGGLGLGIARGLAEKQGGALMIESREGVGTSVRILLPLSSSGRLQLGNDDLIPRNCGMTGILTELAWLLDSDCFSEEYTD